MLATQDFRFATPMWSGAYADMPYIVRLPSGNLFATLTVSDVKEGADDQHCIGLRSTDNGVTWTVRGDIDPPTYPESSWAMPWVDPVSGTLYIIELYNRNNVRTIPYQNTSGSWARVDIVGTPRVKKSTDEGATWQVAGPNGYVTLPSTAIDLRNPWGGAHKLLWLSGHPKIRNGFVYAGFTKMGRVESGNQFGDTEAFIMRAPLTALDTQWSVLPANGIKVAPHPVIAPNGSPVAEEPSFVFLDDSTIYCTFRTICGRLAEAVSVDAGVNFTSGWAEEANGRTIYHPRAKAVVHDLEDGRFLLWHHNNSENDFTGRNVAWYRLGSRFANRILWGAPKALAFADDLQAGVSYPAFLNDGTDLIITATDKKTARCWRVAKADL